MKKTDRNGRRASRLSEGTTARRLDYEISYTGKKSASDILRGSPSSPQLQLSVTVAEGPWRNRLYAGENLGLLRHLCDDKEVCGKVALVYIDPPFATGSLFESRDAETAYHDAALGA